MLNDMNRQMDRYMKNTTFIRGLVLLLLVSSFAFAQEQKRSYKEMTPDERSQAYKQELKQLKKSLQDDDRHDRFKETIINGNQVRVLITNQGSISTPAAAATNNDLVWPNGSDGLGYGYEFGPMVGAEVIDDSGNVVHIISDGFLGGSGGEFNPVTGERWGWEPKLGFSDENSNEVATFTDLDRDFDGKPDSWPARWFNETLGRYVWPAFLGDDATTPDEEVYYVMDDWDNAEFAYSPSPGDPTIKGLGLELQVRIFQFNNPLAEDMMFLVYTVTNTSEKRLDKVFLGMYGDPHVGGPNDFSDDSGGFISAFNEDFDLSQRNMLYAFDEDGSGGGGLPTGYFGYRFLESPGIDNDGQDNDGDLITDESQFNDAGTFEFRSNFGTYRSEPGFAWTGDEDGDWLAEFDDVGVDGLAGTSDFGEGDGKPNQLFYSDLNNNGIFDSGEPTSESRMTGMRFFGGEPNFGFLDIAESDQLGLTSFNALLWGNTQNRPRNDELMWDLMSTPNQREGDPPPIIEQEQDNVFIYGSGPFALDPGESQRFSIALILGQDFTDLLSNATISQQVFDSDYRFAQAPRKPNLTAVPGDKKVTLYWDTAAEASFDPFISRANPEDPSKGFDFEGYRIYRSQDLSFNDTKTITDSRGNPFLSVPLLQDNGLPAQWDLVNEFEGLSDIEYAGRGVRYDLGRNTGLVHSFVDSNNVVNGVTYYYAVTSYDHGDVNADISPTESQRVIQRDAVTRLFSFDVNTAQVIPNPLATGFQGPGVVDDEDGNAERTIGDATGSVQVEFLDPLKVVDGKSYDVAFDSIEVDSAQFVVGYSVVDNTPRQERFRSRDTLFANLGVNGGIEPGSVSVEAAAGGSVNASRYLVDFDNARIRGASTGDLPLGEEFIITFKARPVNNSPFVNNEDDNPVFDGMRVFVQRDSARLSPLVTDGGKSGFKSIVTETNFSNTTATIGLSVAGASAPIAADYEIRFVDYDTSATGELLNPADFTPAALGNFALPFYVADVATGDTVNIFIDGTDNNRWDWYETITLLKPGPVSANTTYDVRFTPPSDTTVSDSGDTTITVQKAIYPGEGDVFLLFSSKPFEKNDRYTFTTRGTKFDETEARDALRDVYVVPNPYVAFSQGEIDGIGQGARDDRRVEFRNLPQVCTIKIFTITGEFVAQIDKDDNLSYAAWNLLSFESQKIAYGVYIFHIDAPGVGTKIGRLGIIK
ncbi:MAG: hypothetical protein ACRBF0_02795 [Calditrichia bacterium]